MKANTDFLIGKKFNKLTVLSFSHTSKSTHKDRIRIKYWFNCVCDCGNLVLISRSCLSLTKGGTKSCGCAFIDGVKISSDKQRGIARPQTQKPNGESVLHTSFLAYKNGAKRRNLKFELTESIFSILTAENCHYCGSEPKELKNKKDSFATRKMNGVDRIDSNVGYTLVNSVPCCKICNYMKQELSEQEFYDHLKKILKFRSNV